MVVYCGFHRNIKQQKLCSTLITIRNVPLSVNYYIRMIYEGSCDYEGRRDDVEISALPSDA